MPTVRCLSTGHGASRVPPDLRSARAIALPQRSVPARWARD